MAKTGTWKIPGEKILPGVYNKIIYIFKAYGDNLNGTIAMPIKSNWGPINKVVTFKNDINELRKIFGSDIDKKYTGYRLGELITRTNVKYIKMVRMADSSAKQSELELKNSNSAQTPIIKIKSKYPTSKDLNVTIKNNIAHSKTVDIMIYEGTVLLATIYAVGGKVDEMVKAINSDFYNNYIVAEKLAESTDPLKEVVNEKLTGGNDGISGINNKSYTDALDLFEREDIDTLVLDGKVDEALNASVIDWINNSYENGRTIMHFTSLGDSEDFNESLSKAKKINNKLVSFVASQGMIDDVEYTYGETAVYLAALETGNKLKESSCNYTTIFNDIKKPLTKEELQDAYKAGVITLDIDGEEVVQVDDVNTYTIYDEGYEANQKIYKYNRTIRTLSAINKMLVKAGKLMIGKVSNDKDVGHEIVLSAFKRGFESLIVDGAITEYNIVIDEPLQAKAESDELYVKWEVSRLDKIKKIYGTGTIK